jgi:hypothetical protein
MIRTTQNSREGTLPFYTFRPSYRQQWLYERRLLRSSKVANQQKRRKVGRPKLPRGDAKGRIVPVRFAADELREMEAAAHAGQRPLSRWIRFVVKEAIMHQKGTEYEQQIESGKAIVKEMLANLATELNEPKARNFEFKVTAQDFDQNRVSIWDPAQERVVAKVKRDDLADSPATPSTRSKLQSQLAAALLSHYARN